MGKKTKRTLGAIVISAVSVFCTAIILEYYAVIKSTEHEMKAFRSTSNIHMYQKDAWNYKLISEKFKQDALDYLADGNIEMYTKEIFKAGELSGMGMTYDKKIREERRKIDEIVTKADKWENLTEKYGIVTNIFNLSERE